MPSFSNAISRRRFLQSAAATAGAASLGPALAACGGGAGSSQTVNLTYWDYYVTQSPYFQNEIKLFQKAHPDITIKKTTQSNAQYDNLYALSVRSHNSPDVALVPQTPTFYEQVQKGWWLPLDKYATSAWRAKFPPLAIHEGSNIFNGKLYSAPQAGLVVPFQLYVNNEVFRNAGLVNADGSIQFPRTWDDVSRAAATINKKSNGQVYGLGFGNGSFNVLFWWFFVFIIGADAPGGPGGQDLRTGTYPMHSNRNYGDWLRLFKEWKTKGFFYPDSLSISDEVARAYFERGKFGMTVGGVWDQGEWTGHQFTDYSLDTLISPTNPPQSYFPTRPGGSTFAISSSTTHPDEAWAWYDWLYSVDAGKRWVQMGEDISIYPQDNNPAFNTFKPFSQYVATAKYAVTSPDPTIRNPATSYVAPATVTPSAADIATGVYTGQITDIDGALLEYEQKALAELNKAITLANQQGHKVTFDDFVFKDWTDLTQNYITKPAGQS